MVNLLSIFIEKFPLLKDMKDLPKEEREELLLRLNDDSETIRTSFATLVTHTQMYLRHSKTTSWEDLRRLFVECEIKELADQIESTDTISMILDKVKNGDYWSFFNYKLLESIITCFCKEADLVAELSKYISDFKVYCQRRVSEVPRGSLGGQHIDQQSSKLLRVKMDNIFSIQKSNLKQIQTIQFQLQKILKIKSLQLIDVDDGCIKLIFRLFDNAVSRVFPLGEEVKPALVEIGVRKVELKTDIKTLSYALDSTALDHQQPPSTLGGHTESEKWRKEIEEFKQQQQHRLMPVASISASRVTAAELEVSIT